MLGNVYKFGEVNSVTINNLEFKYFLSYGTDSNLNLGDNKLNFLIDNQLIDILVEQDYDKLLKYKLESLITIYENKIVSISDDGSMISIDRKSANL